MRINKFVAAATGLSRRAVDEAVMSGRVTINQATARPGDQAGSNDKIFLDGRRIELPKATTTLMLNKPAGYVCSRNGQGSSTIYELLPAKYHSLKPAGRLDKDSSGLVILTDDGNLAQQLTHPSHAKTKLYEVRLDQSLQPLHQQIINNRGVPLEDGLSQFHLSKIDVSGRDWQVTMYEGRNRQIRRTFGVLGYDVTRLHRTNFGAYRLEGLPSGRFKLQL